MPSYVFGKSIEFRFNPVVNGEPVKVYSLTSARIYSSKPNETQIEDSGQASTGHVGSRITSWKANGEFEKLITFDPLSDSDPHSGTEYETYFVVVNFKYESTGQEKHIVEVVQVYRPDALTSRITVDYLDVIKIENVLQEIYSAADIEGFISEAREDVFLRFEGMDKQRKRLFDLEKLNRAVKYRAAALACISLYNQNAPHWKDKYMLRNEQYETAFSATSVGYDVSGQDAPEPTERTSRSVVYVTR